MQKKNVPFRRNELIWQVKLVSMSHSRRIYLIFLSMFFIGLLCFHAYLHFGVY